jgi:hypothetical protein
MRGDGEDHGPKIPIPGAAGAAIFAALKSLALLCGEGKVTIIKERLPSGGYTYLIANNQNPARPVRS